MANAWAAELAAIPGLRVRWDQPLARYTTYKVGGPADALVWADDDAQAAAIISGLHDLVIPLVHIRQHTYKYPNNQNHQRDASAMKRCWMMLWSQEMAGSIHPKCSWSLI